MSWCGFVALTYSWAAALGKEPDIGWSGELIACCYKDRYKTTF